MILVFTGNGKGKTTASLGQAIRALGQGKRVFIVQFIKGPWETGEDKFFEQIANSKWQIEIKKTGKGFVKILGDNLPFKEHQKAAQEGLELAEKAIKSKKYDLIILDEINNAANLKLIKVSDVLRILKTIRGSQRKNLRAPRSELRSATRGESALDIILTGRNAPKSFIKIADIATEMKEIKHVFNKDKKSAKKGVEY